MTGSSLKTENCRFSILIYLAILHKFLYIKMLWLFSRIEGYEVTEQTLADCRRLMDGKVDARTLVAKILARRKSAARRAQFLPNWKRDVFLLG